MPNQEAALKVAVELAASVLEVTEGRGYVSLTDLEDQALRFVEHHTDSAGSRSPYTAIEEKVDHLGLVLRRLVAVTGFQAELVVYGGDYEERGTHVHRDCRITIRREEFEVEHLKVLTAFADEYGCSLVVGKHGATLRLQGNHLKITQSDGVEVNAVTTGTAPGSAGSA
jgi:hypothetical protein